MKQSINGAAGIVDAILLEKVDLKPREYQTELVTLASRENGIIFMPTGSGKTFVASMLIKELGLNRIEKKFTKGGKRTFFLVNTVQLVAQQAASVERDTPFTVGRYSGDMNVDVWEQSTWNAELDKNNVIVMTAQIFLNLILHGFLNFSQVNLIILDECHHAGSNHVMKQIMDHYKLYEGERPHVLGLTATLFNGSVKEDQVLPEVQKLENTLCSKVLIPSNEGLVQKFSTHPIEEFVFYDGYIFPDPFKSEMDSVMNQILSLIEKVNLPAREAVPLHIIADDVKLIQKKKTWAKVFQNMLSQIKQVGDGLGPFAAGKAILALIVRLERMKLGTLDVTVNTILNMCTTKLQYLRKCFADNMSSEPISEWPLKFASPKMKKLLDILWKMKNSSFSAIIFVELRFTAKTLHYVIQKVLHNVHSRGVVRGRKAAVDLMVPRRPEDARMGESARPAIKNLENKSPGFSPPHNPSTTINATTTKRIMFTRIQDLVEHNEQFAHLKSDFVVGFNNNPLNSVKEMTYEKKVTSQAMERFNSKITNLLVASSVIEEGTDISHCNYVVRFDQCKSFRSYVQSKGRARFKDSIYYIFCKDYQTMCLYESFRKIENELVKVLWSSNGDFVSPYVSEPMEPFAPYGPDGPKITVLSAMGLISRYINQLPCDRYAMLSVFWWSKHRSPRDCLNSDSGTVKAILQLPINSAIKELVEGQWCRNIADAKRCAALVACKMLFELDELDENLLPRGPSTEALNDREIFSLWQTDDNSHHHKTGTVKRVRMYDVQYPTWITRCLPTPGVQLHLHVFSVIPVFDTNESTRIQAFKNHFQSPMEFAMLSSKAMPQLPNFPAFMNVGQLDVTVLENCETVYLSADDLKLISEFHTFLFTVALTVGQKFLTRDHEDGDNSFWIVPVIKDLKMRSAMIDWTTIRNHKELPSAVPVSVEERSTWNIKASDYSGKIVVPWYRPGTDRNLRYVITKVREDLNPLSPFPSETFKNYSEYVRIKYGAQVVNNQQPLIEVRAITSRINCLKPRGSKEGTRKRHIGEADSEETLIPELCTLIEFPAPYMLKSMLLPTICHRVHQMLIAEELRLKLISETSIGQRDPPAGGWKKLHVNKFDVKMEESPALHSTVGVSDLLNQKMGALQTNNQYPWQENDEPADVERLINHVDLLSLIHYNNFFSSSPGMRVIQGVGPTAVEGFYRGTTPVKVEGGIVPPLKFVNIDFKMSQGPEITDLLTVLTSSRANDIVNYERLETLGDSFLKFGISLSLFVNYPLMDEGKLTELKGKIVGNRHLFYCGNNLGLGKIIKSTDFAPEDWLPPGFTILKPLKRFLIERKMTPGMFFGIELNQDEINSGLLSPDSLDRMEKIITRSMKSDPGLMLRHQRTSSPFLGTSSVPDKVVSDVVEALLGCYLKSSGLRSTFQMCKYLQILPPKLCNLEAILDEKPQTALRAQTQSFNYRQLLKVEEVEQTLGYCFNDKSFLVQAFSHSSSPHYLTDCYQRLEFLGDAVLDFLITLHVYDSCGKLSPGDLTDLRSALVNNITFSCLTVKYNFHKHFICRSFVLMNAITTFAERQAARGNTIGAEVLFLLEESDVNVAESIDVPKALGDLFEAIIGAVFLDSGKSLEATWNVVYGLMKEQIQSFSENVPINTVRLLYEKFPTPSPKFGKSRLLEDGRVAIPVEVITNCVTDPERKSFVGIGLTKSAAKLAAAKIALRHYHNRKTE